jgi:hypothetical protein
MSDGWVLHYLYSSGELELIRVFQARLIKQGRKDNAVGMSGARTLSKPPRAPVRLSR